MAYGCGHEWIMLSFLISSGAHTVGSGGPFLQLHQIVTRSQQSAEPCEGTEIES